MKELTPEEMKQVSGGAQPPQPRGPLVVLFDQLGKTLDALFGKKMSPL